jgi:hypothetical protein
MIRLITRVLSVAVFACLASPSRSHQLSPCLRVLVYDEEKSPALSQAPVDVLVNHCEVVLAARRAPYFAVHEHMTVASIHEYRGLPIYQRSGWKLNYVKDKQALSWSRMPGRHHSTLRIINGIWWNDEPLMRTWGQHKDFVWGGLDAAKGLEEGRKAYPGAQDKCQVGNSVVEDYVLPNVHLGRWSHLGDGQHLHFMTTLPPQTPGAERVAKTTEAALEWMAFAYEVATGARKPTDQFTPEDEARLKMPSIAENHCVKNRESVKVQTLFTRTGWRDSRLRARATPDVALGSMLHVIQDSFSPSHTCRVKRTVNGATFAVLVDVENYSAQSDKALHQKHDEYPQWQLDYARSAGKVHTYANDPISVGKWLIEAVDLKKDWSVVRQHLIDTVFAKGAPRDSEQCIERKGKAPSASSRE